MSTIPRKFYMVAAMLLAGCSVSGNPLGGNARHGHAVAEARCSACHGADGNSTIPAYPRIAGLDAGYLYGELEAFRNGSRHSPVMTASLAKLSDADLRDVAVYYAGLPRGTDPAGPADSMAQGRQLFLYGSADGRVPACAACHVPGRGGMGRMGGGMRMGRMSMMGGTGGARAPSLYGQHAPYVVSQLDAFANGSRPASVMGPIASAMTAEQARAVADYAAAHPE